MVSLTTRSMLFKAAGLYVNQKKAFSKEEIVKRVNEIKYLSSQKKVPKLTLRKEIVHLETKLQDIFELEKKLFEQEKKESIKIERLNKEISVLKKRIATSEDKDLHKKVDKLSYLLGETMAKKVSAEDIALSRKISEEHKTKRETSQKKLEFVRKLLDRLAIVKREIISKEDINLEVAKILEERVEKIEKRLRSYFPPSKEKSKEKKSKHTLIFEGPKPTPVVIDDSIFEKALPLPPPPKLVRKKTKED